MYDYYQYIQSTLICKKYGRIVCPAEGLWYNFDCWRRCR